MRASGRANDEKRTVTIKPNVLKNASGSVLISCGNTEVIVSAMVVDDVPPFLAETGRGWLTAEYAMLPASTPTRKRREKMKPDGRSTEIQRLIGRSLRSVMDFSALGERTIYIDCDVISADGGTRTASITGGYAALKICVDGLLKEGKLTQNPIRAQVAAISCGIVDGEALLDLEYTEDSSAEADMNVVMTDGGGMIEVQCTGEKRPISEDEFVKLLALAKKGIAELCKIQASVEA
ncbi:MAG: ribonuclease PH [Eubacteriales bacterium]